MVTSRTSFVNSPRNHFFSGASFALDQYSGIYLRNPRHLGQQCPEFRPGTNQIRRRHTLLLIASSLRLRLRSCPLSGDPLADVWIAIHERNVTVFAVSQKVDAVLTCQGQVLEVEGDAS